MLWKHIQFSDIYVCFFLWGKMGGEQKNVISKSCYSGPYTNLLLIQSFPSVASEIIVVLKTDRRKTDLYLNATIETIHPPYIVSDVSYHNTHIYLPKKKVIFNQHKQNMPYGRVRSHSIEDQINFNPKMTGFAWHDILNCKINKISWKWMLVQVWHGPHAIGPDPELMNLVNQRNVGQTWMRGS